MTYINIKMSKLVKNIFESSEAGIWKIVMEDNFEYAWNFKNGNKYEWLSDDFRKGLIINDNWFNKENYSKNDYNEKIIYNIQIIYNYEEKAMINIKTKNGNEFRQEINPWNSRNSQEWLYGRYVVI